MTTSNLPSRKQTLLVERGMDDGWMDGDGILSVNNEENHTRLIEMDTLF